MSGAPGRPLSAELSEQLLSVAVDILADDGATLQVQVESAAGA